MLKQLRKIHFGWYLLLFAVVLAGGGYKMIVSSDSAGRTITVLLSTLIDHETQFSKHSQAWISILGPTQKVLNPTKSGLSE